MWSIIKKVKTNSLQRWRQVLCGGRAELKALSLHLRLDNRAELLAFQSRTADQKKISNSLPFLLGNRRARGFFRGSKCSPRDSNWKPRVLLPIQPSSSSAQGSGSVERKSIHQGVIMGLIRLLLQSSVIQLSGRLLSPAQPGINSLDGGLGSTKNATESATLWKLRIHWLWFVQIQVEPVITLGFTFELWGSSQGSWSLHWGSWSRSWVLSPLILFLFSFLCGSILALLFSMPLFTVLCSMILQCPQQDAYSLTATFDNPVHLQLLIAAGGLNINLNLKIQKSCEATSVNCTQHVRVYHTQLLCEAIYERKLRKHKRMEIWFWQVKLLKVEFSLAAM